jgi:FdhE protein
MSTAATALADLERRHPEWAPWLAVVAEVVRESESDTWDAFVPELVDSSRASVPLLADVVVAVPAAIARRLLDRLCRIASVDATPKMASLKNVARTDANALALFRASLCQDAAAVHEASAPAGTDAEALQAVVSLLAVPFLHACRRRWNTPPRAGWEQGCCPVCGAWPAFTEVRGIERSRHHRCGRCGGEWHARALYCPFCSMDDHKELVSLLPQHDGTNAAIEACRRCLGYVKTFTRLQGCAPAAVMIEDLASVNLDIAALDQGYLRPQGAGHRLDVTLSEVATRRRFFAWS